MGSLSLLLSHSEIDFHFILSYSNSSIHSAMDAFAQTLMKDAVNCDKHSDLQNSVNQLDFEYGLCCRGCPCKHTFSIYLVLCTAFETVLSAHQGYISLICLAGSITKGLCFFPATFCAGWAIA